MTKARTPEPTIFSSNKQFILQVISLKYFFIACLLFFITIAFLFNRYSKKEYETYATISPVNNDASSILSSNDLFRGLQTFQAYNEIENEISNLKSFTLISSTISKLNLELGYFSEKKKLFKETTEISDNSPFYINVDKSHVQPIDTRFYVSILNDSIFRLTSDEKDVSLYNYIDNKVISENNRIKTDTICRFNETISNRNFKFSVTSNKKFQIQRSRGEVQYFFEFYNLDLLAKDYLEKLIVSRVFTSSILNIQLSGENIEKVIIFLNNYLNFYFEESLIKKNKIAVNTINFIDSQISEISDSLVLSESKLRNFKSAHQVTNLSYQGQMAYDRLQQVDAEITDMKTQERYYDYIIDYFKKNSDMSGVVPPSSMNVEDPILNQLIGELLALNTERSNIINNRGARNLFLGEIENKINTQKQAIIENVNNNMNTLNLTLNELNYRAEKLSNEISNLPRTELNMVSIQRKFNIDDAIYTYLLQKRSEAAITMASNYPDYEILEPAREVTSEMVAPRTIFNYLVALLLGLLIPIAYIVVRELFNNKIQNVQFIEHLLDRSVLGIVYSNDRKSESVLIDYPISAVSESFRNLRSNIFMKFKSPESKIILVTSSQPRDGKSFISFNLSVAVATVGHKTLIIDGDLRRPTIHEKFKTDNVSGLSNYMTKGAIVSEIIHETTIENLSFIPAGPVLPNPPEIIESGVLDELIDYLKNKYEYIIIDTTPVGIVADAVLLMRYASHILVVTRKNYTRKDVLTNVTETLETHKFENYDIVYNDMNIKESPYRLYSNYYIKNINS
ncbi:MAG: polysaccharide biosynthesis tyrosine autokinase [Bacteroidales bacterium]|jgi:capsular exopolysaccharide synthesis family protein|nr:polysaccharide biosynthesis tyrosine autokinase [Bacteroidales bacterium]